VLLHSKLDWIDDPLCQECIVCKKPHPRLFAQPRSDPVLNGQYADCTGGLRISADRMLCGSCCGYMLENRNHSIGARLLSLGIDNGWTHKWHTKWQRGHLTLSVQSRRGMADIRDLSTVRLKHTALWRLFIGLSWCGCTAIKVYLFVGTFLKIQSSHSHWSRWNKSSTRCQDCHTSYVLGIVKEKGGEVLQITRSNRISNERQRGSGLVAALQRTVTKFLPGLGRVASITKDTASKRCQEVEE